MATQGVEASVSGGAHHFRRVLVGQSFNDGGLSFHGRRRNGLAAQ